MEYQNVYTGIFRERPNRFIAMVELAGVLEACHVKNTGRCREPNDATHPAFGETLRKAAAAGVRVMAYDCVASPGSIRLDKEIPVKLTQSQGRSFHADRF